MLDSVIGLDWFVVGRLHGIAPGLLLEIYYLRRPTFGIAPAYPTAGSTQSSCIRGAERIPGEFGNLQTRLPRQVRAWQARDMCRRHTRCGKRSTILRNSQPRNLRCRRQSKWGSLVPGSKPSSRVFRAACLPATSLFVPPRTVPHGPSARIVSRIEYHPDAGHLCAKLGSQLLPKVNE